MSLTKKWMEEQGMFEDDAFINNVDDVDYEYEMWLSAQKQKKDDLESESDY